MGTGKSWGKRLRDNVTGFTVTVTGMVTMSSSEHSTHRHGHGYGHGHDVFSSTSRGEETEPNPWFESLNSVLHHFARF